MNLQLTIVILGASLIAGKQEKCIKILDDKSLEIEPVSQASWPLGTYPACGYFSNQINQTGWSQLRIWINPKSHYNDTTLAYLAGYLEGNFTRDLIEMHAYNLWDDYCANEKSYCRRVFKFLGENEAYVEEMVKKNGEKDPYWYHVGIILHQMTGIQEAVNRPVVRTYQHGIRIDTKGEVYMNNLFGDLIDLENILDRTMKSLSNELSHCSALVKLLNNDLLIGHTMWAPFGVMLRILKKYDFPFRADPRYLNGTVPDRLISMSSYPGNIFSMDDFYLISSGLVVQETTNRNLNKTSYGLTRPRGIVLTSIRNMVANRLATNGESWSKIFSQANSGTYNNQFMIVDYKQFSPNRDKAQSPGLLWILEQMPSSLVARDMTDLLMNQGYWLSFNLPYFNQTYRVAGFYEAVRTYDSFYIYDQNPRARLFKRKHHEVVDYKSLMKLLEYNNFRHDPESRCEYCSPPFEACFSLACRPDLHDINGIYPKPALGAANFSTIDAKVTSWRLFKNLTMFAVSRPPYHEGGPIRPFSWSNFSLKGQIRHRGQPDLWNFKPLYF